MRLQENHGLQNSPWGGEVNHIWPLAYTRLDVIIPNSVRPSYLFCKLRSRTWYKQLRPSPGTTLGGFSSLNYDEIKLHCRAMKQFVKWAPSSEFVSSSIPSWHILTAHAQPFRGARDLAFCLKVPLDSLLVWASSEGSGETARMRRLAWTFAARKGDKYQIRLARPKW